MEMKESKIPFAEDSRALRVETPGKNILACLLGNRELAARKKKLQKEIFSQVQSTTELEDGYRFHFLDKKGMDRKIFDFILTEKACCPFFKYEVNLDPHSKKIDLSLRGLRGGEEFH